MRKRFKNIFNLFYLSAYADGGTTVATNSGVTNGGTIFTDGTRIVYSKELEFKALPNLRFAQFATTKTELGKEPGMTISMLTYDNLKQGGKLDELKEMDTQALSGSMKQITVTEHGNAVANSELLIQSSFDDVMETTTTLLGRDYAIVLDCELRDTALSTTNRIYAGGKDSRSALTDKDTLSVSTIKDGIEILATNNAPKYGNTSWICFVHPHQSRGLRDDPAWINASNYGSPDLLFTGEIGRIDDTRFIETTLMCNGKAPEDDSSFNAELKKGYKGDGDTTALAVDVYQSVIFGDQYYGIAWSLPPEIRDNGVEDFGRKRSLAWYSIFGTGLLHDNYGVVMETA